VTSKLVTESRASANSLKRVYIYIFLFYIYLVDEFRTSCKCSNCDGGDCIKSTIRPNPRPYNDNLILLHTLIHCKNVECGVWWNRDCNGAKNIYKIAENAIKRKERPTYLCREKSNSQTLITKRSKPKITRHAKAKPCS